MRKYRTLLFDLDDTLLDYTGDEKRCIIKVFDNNSIIAPENVYELYYSIDDWQEFSMGNITPKAIMCDHFRRLCQMLDINEGKIPSLCDEFYENFENCHRLKYGARKVLNYLKDKGYRIYIITNGFSEFIRKRIKDAKLEKYFDDIFVSEELDVRKPNKVFFDRVIARIGESKRQNILIIGDAPTTDVLSGINAGIDVCWLNDRDKYCNRKHRFEIKALKELINIL